MAQDRQSWDPVTETLGPVSATPSPVPGLSQAEYDEIREHLRTWDPLPLHTKLAVIRRGIAQLRRLDRLVEVDDERAR